MIQAIKRFFSSSKILLCMTVITSIVLLTTAAFHLQLEICLGPFLEILEILLAVVLAVQFLVNLLWSFGLFSWFVFKHRKIGMMTLLPLVINIVVILLLMFVPFETFGMKYDWLSHYQVRMQVVDMIKNNAVSPEMMTTGQLPEGYKDAAVDGRVSSSRRGTALSVFFTVKMGILNDYSGFAYVSDRDPAKAGLGGPNVSVQPIADCWFWCESTN